MVHAVTFLSDKEKRMIQILCGRHYIYSLIDASSPLRCYLNRKLSLYLHITNSALTGPDKIKEMEIVQIDC